MTERIARFKPGENVPVFATTQILAGRFVAVAGLVASGAYAGAAFNGAHAAAGVRPFGVSEQDSAPATFPAHSHDRMVNVVRRGAIAEVEAGEAITQGAEVAVGANGKAVNADAAVAATLATGVVGDDNAITWTAKELGTPGNSLSVTIVDPAGNNVALSVDVDQEDIVVTAATDGSSVITSTAADVIAAVNEHDQASQLVDVANTGASDGTGLVVAVAETALAGGTDATNAALAVGRALKTASGDGEFTYVDLY